MFISLVIFPIVLSLKTLNYQGLLLLLSIADHINNAIAQYNNNKLIIVLKAFIYFDRNF